MNAMCRQSANGKESDKANSEEQHAGIERFRYDHGLQSADDSVDGDNHRNQQHGELNGQVKELMEDNSAGVETHSYMNEQSGEYRHEGKNGARSR